MMRSRSEEKPTRLEQRKLEGQENKKTQNLGNHNKAVPSTFGLMEFGITVQTSYGFPRHYYFSSQDGPPHGATFCIRIQHEV